jgi:hypothetical protein
MHPSTTFPRTFLIWLARVATRFVNGVPCEWAPLRCTLLLNRTPCACPQMPQLFVVVGG